MRQPNTQQLGTLKGEQASAIINSYYERMHDLILYTKDNELREEFDKIVGVLPPLLIKWFNDEISDRVILSKVSEIIDQIRQLKEERNYVE